MRRRTSDGYDAFLSYSHEADRDLAGLLQTGVERFAKPWNRMRALHVFRDSASLSADPGLWSSIERALASASWFVLLASPTAAGSPWVDRELRWWREHRSARSILMVLTSGELHWDERVGDYDPNRSTALPPALLGAFAEEPHWVDATKARAPHQASKLNPVVQDAIVDLAATIRGVPKDALVGQAVREHRRAMRLARGAQAGLAALLVLVATAATIAIQQRDTARDQATIARSRQLAATAVGELSTNLDVSQLLAAAALRTRATTQTRSALMHAATASPHLVRFVPLRRRVVALAGSGDGTAVVAGLADGAVVRWTATDPVPRQVLHLRRAIASLTVADDGTAVAAADGRSAVLWRSGGHPLPLKPPAGQMADGVALSPSSRTAVVHGRAPGFRAAASLTVFDAVGDRRLGVHDDPWHDLASTSGLVLAGDDELVLFDTAYGGWERRQLPEWEREDGSSASFGTHQWSGPPSADGSRFAATNGGSVTPVWTTHGRTPVFNSPFTVEAPAGYLTGLALSPDGRRAALANNGTILVAPVRPRGAPHAPPIALEGNGSINFNLLRFYGDGDHLLAASGAQVSMWDLRQLDRIARTTPLHVRGSCNACSGPLLAVSPDGKRLAVMDGNGGSTFVQPLHDDARTPVARASIDRSFVEPLWAGNRLVLPIDPWSPGEPGFSTQDAVAWLAGPPGAEDVVTAGLGTDGRTVFAVDSRGRIALHDALSGRIRSVVPGPRELAHGSEVVDAAAVGSATDLVAMVVAGTVRVVDPYARRLVGRIGGNGEKTRYVAFSGRRLLVQREDGSLEVWDERGKRRERVIDGDESYVWPPVGNPQGTLVARQRGNGTVALYDLDDGTALATFALPGDAFLAKTGVTFSPDGTRLITVTEGDYVDGAGGRLVVRDLSDASLLRVACRTAGRDLTPAEWQTFVGGDPPGHLSCLPDAAG